MKTLTLLRHAKAALGDPGLRDVDRPLNDKGRRAAQTVGRDWRGRGLAFDHVLASPAVRVRQTIAEVEAGYGQPLSPGWEGRAYLAEPETLLELARGFPPSAARALLVAHSPGLERLVLLLAAASALCDCVADKFPTASVAELEWDGDWRDMGAGGATLVRFTRPRDLDPSLGPDEL